MTGVGTAMTGSKVNEGGISVLLIGRVRRRCSVQVLK